MEKIIVSAIISASQQKVWDCYTQTLHIVNWNFADSSWHCPKASNNLVVGGKYSARMEAKDGSAGFDFDAVYTEVSEGESFTYEFGGRTASVRFEQSGGQTLVSIAFDPENEHPLELQKGGWQAILNNFKNYTELIV
jgi:uncharacterized protein YndB with AHSA1/START domain